MAQQLTNFIGEHDPGIRATLREGGDHISLSRSDESRSARRIQLLPGQRSPNASSCILLSFIIHDRRKGMQNYNAALIVTCA
jgi:hypothetical protein